MGANRSGCDAGDGCFRVEQGRNLAALRRRRAQQIRVVGQRHARPILAQRTAVFLTVRGRMQHGDGMVKQILLVRAKHSKIRHGRIAQVGLRLSVVLLIKQRGVRLQVKREHVYATFNNMDRRKLTGDKRWIKRLAVLLRRADPNVSIEHMREIFESLLVQQLCFPFQYSQRTSNGR